MDANGSVFLPSGKLQLVLPYAACCVLILFYFYFFYLLQMLLPESIQRENNKMFEQVEIPPNEPMPIGFQEKPVYITELDEVCVCLYVGFFPYSSSHFAPVHLFLSLSSMLTFLFLKRKKLDIHSDSKMWPKNEKCFNEK